MFTAAVSGKNLHTIRLFSGIICLLLFASWAAGLPIFIHGIQTNLDSILSLLFNNAWTIPAVRAAAGGLGIPASLLGWYWVVIEVSLAAAFGTTGLVIFFRKPDLYGTFLGVTFVLIGTRIGGPVTFTLGQAYPALAWLLDFLSVYAFFGFASILLVFPDGRFVPAWSRWGIPLFFLMALSIAFFSRQHMSISLIGFFGYIGAFAAATASQIYRFARVSGPVERQQSKWALGSFSVFLLNGMLWGVINPNLIQHSSPPTAVELLSWIIYFGLLTLTAILFIAALAIAIFRYRLYNIDIIIRRTLLYSIITVTLAVIFFGSVVVMQQVFVTLTGQESQLAVILSTLGIAALFSPLRRKVQEFIDRRFYRQKYDTARMLVEWAQTARDEVELERLTARLLHVVHQTLQPERAAIWLKRNIKP